MALLDEIGPRDFPDRAFRYLLQHPRNLQELVESVAPDIAARLDFDHMLAVPRDFLMEDWRKRESDVLYRVPYRTEEGGSILVCVLLEHQSTSDPRMSLRMLLYSVLYWEREWKQWESERAAGNPLRLTTVLPIVFHTGERPWLASRQLPDLFDVPESLARLVPQWPILFWDLAERSVQELVQESRDWIRTLAVVRAEGDESDTFQEALGRVLHTLEPLAATDAMRWHDLMGFVLSWAVYRRPRPEIERVKQTANASFRDRKRRREVQNMIESTKQTLAEWAFEHGQEAGMARGIAEGELKARRDAIKEVLIDRFGELPAEFVAKIDATTDVERLRNCLRQSLRIQSLDELTL